MYSVKQEALGRGINIVVVDPQTKSVTKIQNFDTYQFGKKSTLIVVSLSAGICKHILYCH